MNPLVKLKLDIAKRRHRSDTDSIVAMAKEIVALETKLTRQEEARKVAIELLARQKYLTATASSGERPSRWENMRESIKNRWRKEANASLADAGEVSR